MNADGTDAHEILANERTGSEGGLQWSPGGDRLAIGLGGAIYTFAPDGSDFTKVITGGHSPNWSPDGSQIAYTIQCGSLRGVGQSGSQPQQVTGVTWYSREDAAERVGVEPSYLVDWQISAFLPRRSRIVSRRATYARNDGQIARGCGDPARRCSRCHPARCHVARLPRHGKLRAIRRSRHRDVRAGQRSDQDPARAADGQSRSDRHRRRTRAAATWLERLLDADAIRTEAEALVPLAETR
jgi:hypothetical protein